MTEIFQNQNGEKYFYAKLVSVAQNPTTYTNAKGEVKTQWPCTIEMVTRDSEQKFVSGIINDGNFKYGMEVGEEYLVNLLTYNDAPLLQVSHLQRRPIGERLSTDEVNELFDVTVKAPAAVSLTPEEAQAAF
jgi:hypothetical protein